MRVAGLYERVENALWRVSEGVRMSCMRLRVSEVYGESVGVV